MLRVRHLPLLAVLAVTALFAAPSQSETIIDEWQSVKAPPPPTLQPVTLDPRTTAVLVIDIIKQTCNPKMRPRCVAIIPNVEKLLTTARANGAYVIYTLFPSQKPATFPNPKISDYVPELAPKGHEPVVTAFVDKFELAGKDTGLQGLLKKRGIKTVIPVGVSSHNGVLFTAVMASLRGFNVVVPVDGMAGNNAYEDQATDYILTNSIVYHTTLTSVDQITFAKK